MPFAGSCHCGTVTFTVDADVPTDAISCNCSHCRRKGFLFAFLPAKAFTITAGHDHLTTYLFNRHNIHHRFCSTCGCQTHGEGSGPGGAKMAAVNLRCVSAIDLDGLTIEQVDGASF